MTDFRTLYHHFKDIHIDGELGPAGLPREGILLYPTVLVMTRFHCNSSRSKIWLFGTRCVICGTENRYGACFGLGTLDWGSHSSLWVPWVGGLWGSCALPYIICHGGSLFMIWFLWNFLVTFFLLLLLSSILQWLLIICKLCNLIDCETIKHIIKK